MLTLKKRYAVCIRTLGILPLAWLSLADQVGASPPASTCNLDKATIQFRSALEYYRGSRWSEAIPDLKKTADLCPVPPKPFSVDARLLEKYPYAPFFYLGRCHDRLEEPPVALRYYYLSSCFDNAEKIAELKRRDDLTDECLKRTESRTRPAKQPPYFSEGVTAKTNKDWGKSAEKMWDSMQVWPEDGETTIIAGRWPKPYAPRFHLANALFELGCQEQACKQLGLSKLKQLAAKDKTGKYDEDRKEMEKLAAKCALRKGGPETMWICQQWQCWLPRDRR